FRNLGLQLYVQGGTAQNGQFPAVVAQVAKDQGIGIVCQKGVLSLLVRKGTGLGPFDKDVYPRHGAVTVRNGAGNLLLLGDWYGGNLKTMPMGEMGKVRWGKKTEKKD